MKRKFFVLASSEKSQALVEFTLVFPILLALVLGLVYVSVLFFSYATLQAAVREGAHTIVTDGKNQDTASITKIVQDNSFSLNNVTVQISPADKTLWTTPRIRITVEAWYTAPFPDVRIPLPGNATVYIGPIRIYAHSNMTTE